MKSFLLKLRQMLGNQSQKEALFNENMAAVNPAATFAMKYKIGLTISFYGGVYQDENGLAVEVDETTIAVPNNQENVFIEFNPSTKLVVSNLLGFTTGFIRIAVVKSENGEITEIFDRRAIAFYAEGTPPNLSYTLPQASATVRGGVTIDPTTLGFTESGQLKVIGGGGGGGGGSLIVQSNGTTINNNTTTLNIKNSNSVSSSGNTVSIDNFFTFENCIAYWRPVNGNVNVAFSLNSWTATSIDNNLGSVLNPTNVWDFEHAKVFKTTNVALSQSRLISGQADLRRSIFTRNAVKTSFGYDRRGNATKGNSAYFTGIQQDNGSNAHPFTNNYATVNAGGIGGIGWRTTDENLQLIYTNAVTSQVVFQDLGSNFPIPEFATNKASYDLIVDSDRSEVDVTITLRRKDVEHLFVQTVPLLKQTGSSSCKFSMNFETTDAVIKYVGQGSVFVYSR